MKKSRRGFMLLSAAAGCALVALAYVRFIYSFLTPTALIDAPTAVVEGWIPDDAMERVAEHIMSRGYETVIVTGGPLDYGSLVGEYRTYAEVGRATIAKLTGRKDIVAVPSPRMQKDRTYASAVSLKGWIDENGIQEKRLNLISSAAHTRRSWRLFELALGDKFRVGILAIPPRAYDTNKWWVYSEGFRTVTSETLAYLYTVFIFPFTSETADGTHSTQLNGVSTVFAGGAFHGR
jgi:hypothetical protein